MVLKIRHGRGCKDGDNNRQEHYFQLFQLSILVETVSVESLDPEGNQDFARILVKSDVTKIYYSQSVSKELVNSNSQLSAIVNKIINNSYFPQYFAALKHVSDGIYIAYTSFIFLFVV